MAISKTSNTSKPKENPYSGMMKSVIERQLNGLKEMKSRLEKYGHLLSVEDRTYLTGRIADGYKECEIYMKLEDEIEKVEPKPKKEETMYDKFLKEQQKKKAEEATKPASKPAAKPTAKKEKDIQLSLLDFDSDGNTTTESLSLFDDPAPETKQETKPEEPSMFSEPEDASSEETKEPPKAENETPKPAEEAPAETAEEPVTEKPAETEPTEKPEETVPTETTEPDSETKTEDAPPETEEPVTPTETAPAETNPVTETKEQEETHFSL